MDDPYKILGVIPDASDEEIKRAYRRLAKQYHPDLHPGDAEAARKMQQINDAYEQIKNPQKRNTGGSSGYDPFGGQDPFRGYRQQGGTQSTQDQYRQAAYQYIRFGQFAQALNILSNCQDRDGQWYYLSALANDGLGNQVTALEHMRKAVSMDPSNPVYLDALSRMEQGGTQYRRQAGNYRGFDMRGSVCPSLCLCWLSQFCCGRGIYCC